MKKLVLTSMAMVLGAVLAHAQGTITISTTAATVVLSSNSVSQGNASGTGYDYEVLVMSQSAYNALSPSQQAAAYNLAANNSDLSLWSDSTVSGTGNSLHSGGVQASGTATASSWAAPTGATYSTGTIDYYSILGWNTALGSWAQVQAFLNAGTLANQTGYFGQTATAYNYSGGGPSGLLAVDMWGTSSTGLAGSGGIPTVGGLTLNAIVPAVTPEPTTLALAGLGGISMLFLRRRKA